MASTRPNTSSRGFPQPATADAIEWRSRQEAGFVELVRDALAAKDGAGPVAGVLSVKLTGVRRLRGLYGSGFASRALARAHDRLRAVLRPGDGLRATGDREFLLFLPRLRNVGHLRLAGHKIVSEFANQQETEGRVYRLGAAVGAAHHSGGIRDAADLVAAADQALSLAASRNQRFMLHDELDKAEAETDLTENLRRALREDELLLHYQPQVSLASGEAAGVEALVRWQHPQNGLIPPASFIPAAECSDVIHDLTRWCLHRALRERAEWQSQGLDLSVSVNVAGPNFRAPDFSKAVLDAVALWGTPPGRLVVEVTESSVVDNMEHVSAELERMREGGIRVAMDDFGTGYSSLAYLHRLPLDELKIDQSFIRHLATVADDRRIVSAILKIAGEFGLHTVAEGIEDGEARDILAALGCDIGQGYYFARPLAPSELAVWLRGARAPAPSPD